MPTPWHDMEEALWDWLEADVSFAALGLTTFAGHEGQFFHAQEIDGGDVLSTSKLPAITTEPTPGGLFGDLGPRSRAVVGQIVPAVSVTLRMIYSAVEGGRGASSAALDQAIYVVLSRINGFAAHRTGLGSSGVVTRIELGTQSLEVVRVEGRPVYWVWSCPLVMEGAPTQV